MKISLKIPKKSILYWALAGACIILAGGCTSTYDYDTFRAMYLGIADYGTEWGFSTFCEVIREFGASYNAFRLICIAIPLILVFEKYKHIVDYSAWFPLLYFSYPLSYDNYNLKNTVAMAFVLLAMYHLLFSLKPKYIKSIVLIILASLFHRSSMIFMLMPVVVFAIENNYLSVLYKIVSACTASVVLATIIYRPIVTKILSAVVAFLGSVNAINSERAVYFSTLGNWGFLLYLFPYLITLLLAYIYKSDMGLWLSMNNEIEVEVIEVQRRRERYFACIIALMPIICLVMANTIFYRIIRNFSLLCYALFLLENRLLAPSNKNKASLLFCVLIIYNFSVFTWGARDITFFTMFLDNWILG